MLGQALNQALGDRRGITRFGSAIVPMDEALALVSVDSVGTSLCGDAHEFAAPMIGALPTQTIPHLLEAFAMEARMNLHVRMLAGDNDHHVAEAAIKGLARSLRVAVAIDERAAGAMPSTKDVL